MATKRKSIIEEALLDAKSLEDALKANTKEILASHMKEEIETIVESSLKEQEDEELEIDAELEGSDEDIEEPADEEAGGDFEVAKLDLGDEVGDEKSELVDLDIDALSDKDGEDIDIDVAELPMDLDLGDAEEIDLTDQSDEEVLKVFKAMGDEDEVEVVRDEGGITLTDNETGAEYYIKESEELSEDDLCEGCDGNHMEEDDDLVYEIELDEHQGYDDEEEDESLGMGRGPERRYRQSYKDRRDDSYGKWGRRGIKERDISLEEEEETYGGNKDDESRSDRDYVEEDKIQRHQKDGYQRKGGAKVGSDQANPYGGRYSESRKSRKPISTSKRSAKNQSQVANSTILKEYKELKTKNNEYKEALKLFKGKLNEVALFNTNLAYVNRLFTEHSTTKKEKMGILKRFDGAEGVKESKNIYKSIKTELDNKTPITESVDNKVNKIVKSSAANLNESTAYVDPQIAAIKDLMKRIS